LKLGRLIVFLLVFSTLYGALHFYGFMKAREALSLRGGPALALAIFMGIMVLAPVIVRILEKSGFHAAARGLAYFGYTWMGILFLFFSVALLLDICRFVFHMTGSILQKPPSGILLSPRVSFFIAFLLSLMIAFYGYFEALGIRTERLIIKTTKIPQEIGKLTIAQISDVHLGLIVGEKRLERILDTIRREKPDILVSTGDLLDGQPDNLPVLSEMLRRIEPRHGKFAVTGNHEFYAGIALSLDFASESGFVMLRDETKDVEGVIQMAGVDDPAGRRGALSNKPSERELLAGLGRERFTILLKHRPEVDQEALGLFDLQLSGHVHRGQIFPFVLLTKLFYPRISGFFPLDKQSSLYVNRGSGTWGPPIRFLAPPEVTVIELVHEGKRQ